MELVLLMQQCLQPRTVVKQGIWRHQVRGYWSCPTSVDCPIHLTSTVILIYDNCALAMNSFIHFSKGLLSCQQLQTCVIGEYGFYVFLQQYWDQFHLDQYCCIRSTKSILIMFYYTRKCDSIWGNVECNIILQITITFILNEAKCDIYFIICILYIS